MTRFRGVVLLGALALVVGWVPVWTQEPLTVNGFVKVGERRVTRTVTEFTYRATLTNRGAALTGATATALSAVPATTVVDGSLAFGPVGPGGRVVSSDTFVFRHDRRTAFRWTNLVWNVAGTPANVAPVANAGPDQRVLVGETVTLDGSGSSDGNGDSLTFAWTLVGRPAGSAATLSDPTAVQPTFVVDLPGTYEWSLRVRDGKVQSPADTVVVSTVNTAPVANAGPDQRVFVEQTVTLDGSGSSDADGNALTNEWTVVSRPAGSTATPTPATAVKPTFVVDRAGTYVFALTVSDGIASSTPDTVTVSTVNTAPVANAGSDQRASVPQTVTLDGSGSSDADRDALTYSWSLLTVPAGSTAGLSNPTAATPTFGVDKAGTYVAQLIVHDGTVASVPDTVTISTTNTPPVAHAGPDQIALTGATVTLDGSLSSDIDGDALTFAWSLVTVPAGSAAVLSNATALTPTFVVDRSGIYVAQLVVHDGTVGSAPDTVVINAEGEPPHNRAPVAQAGADRSVTTGESVALDGSSSFDPDGDSITYAWSLVSKPVGSIATLSSSTASATFVPDVTGDYVIRLAVSDSVLTGTDTLTILASAPSTLTVTGGTVSVGDVIVGIVTLPNVATTNVEVALSSSAPGRAQVPADLLILAGAQTGSFSIDGVTAGDATITASTDALGSAAATVFVRARGFDFGPELIGVNVGIDATGTIVLRAPAPVGGASIKITSEDSAKLAVRTSTVAIPEGGQIGEFTVRGVAIGTARVIAIAEAGVEGQASQYVSVVEAATDPTKTSADLIDDAREAGAITDEQALLYDVYAAFASPKLPSAYKGRFERPIDSQLVVEIGERWSSLTPDTQRAIAPFMVPPIYVGSWGDPDVDALAGGVAGVTAFGRGALVGALDAASPDPCGLIAPHLPTVLARWAKRVTPHFNIWYRNYPTPWNDFSPEQAARGADNLAAIAEEVYLKLTGVMGRVPDSDAGVACNGGDGKLDVYIERNSAGLMAQVNAYAGGCDRNPSYMWFAGRHALDPEEARDLFAHEFLHMVQFAFDKGTDCKDYGWIDEATANWAIEYAYHKDNYEHRFFKAALTEPGQSDGSNRADLTEINIPLDLGVKRKGYTTHCKGAGYCDYPFFLYLAKRFGPNVIRRTYEGSELFDPIASVEYGAGGGALRNVWHDYSLALYNDFTGNVAKDFHGWDDIVHGIRWTTLNLGWDEKAEIAVALDGVPGRGFKAEIAAALARRDPRNPGHSPVYRLSTRALSFKFTDPAVSFVSLVIPDAGSPDLKIWAIQRLNGAWKAPEDWTDKGTASFCRDVRDENLEELVLIYSNGNSTARREGPGFFVELDPFNSPDKLSMRPRLYASNAGCWKWRGSASFTIDHPDGHVRTESATSVVMERRLPEAGFTHEGFEVLSALVKLEHTGRFNELCTIQNGPASASLTRETFPGGLGGIAVAIADVDPVTEEDKELNRRAIGAGVGAVTSTLTLSCEDQDPITTTTSWPIQWMRVPLVGLEGVKLSEDGRQLKGTLSATALDGSVGTMVIDFTAEKE